MYSNGIRLNAASYGNVFSTSSGTLCVPVKPSAVIYSQFDYVRGTAVSQGQKGVPVDRIRILNTLISQLVSMKKKNSSSEDFSILTDEQKDELIKEYQNQIKVSLSNAARAQSYGLAGVMPEAGTLISISA
jgi:hypothetical protein